MKHLIVIILSLSYVSIFAQIPNTLSNSDKIYGLSKFWQEVNYNFVYLNKIDREKWESDYKNLIIKVQETTNDYEYYRLLQKFCATLKDGHTNVYFPKEINEILFNTYFGAYRIFLTNIDGKAIVTRTNLSKKDVLPIGTEIIKVNGMDTKTYLEKEVIPYISSSTDYILMDKAVRDMFKAPKGTSFQITFKYPDGRIKEMKLTHEETLEKEVYPEFEDRELFQLNWINDEIAHVSLNSFGNPKIDTLFVDKLPELYKAKKLIIDLRKNGGGNTWIGREILEYLTNDTLLYGSKNQSRLHIPSYKAWGKWTDAQDTLNNEFKKQAFMSFRDNYFHTFPYEAEPVTVDAKQIVVPTALLIGHQTASAAEDFLIYAANQEHMIKIGAPTYGSTGQPMLFDLPGGGSARVCTKKDTYPDGTEFVGYGIQPDIEVKRSLNDYLHGNDPVLLKAISYLKNKE